MKIMGVGRRCHVPIQAPTPLNALSPAELPRKIEALKRRCDEVGRDVDEIEVSQQCIVVIGRDHETARKQLEKAKQIHGGHMGGSLEQHGIWGAPDEVIEKLERHRQLGCSFFPIRLASARRHRYGYQAAPSECRYCGTEERRCRPLRTPIYRPRPGGSCGRGSYGSW